MRFHQPWVLFGFFLGAGIAVAQEPSPDQVRQGLKNFFAKTAKPDGSFRPGIPAEYAGMSDCAFSDLAGPVYAVVIHKTLGWQLPHEDRTREFLLSRQDKDGGFFNVAGTVDPKSALGRAYNTTQGLVALRALGVKPRFDALPVFDVVLQEDYKKLPLYMTSFFPLAYLAAGKSIPPEADRKIRALMSQGKDGYLGEHVAATFHAVHYYRLVGEKTPHAEQILERALKDQHANGGWLINPPARDRHATFDAVFTLRHLGGQQERVRQAMAKATRWVLSCRNADGGFGHFPGSPSDMDAVYFHVATLVMTGWLPAAEPLPPDPHLLCWGHLLPTKR